MEVEMNSIEKIFKVFESAFEKGDYRMQQRNQAGKEKSLRTLVGKIQAGQDLSQEQRV